MLFYNLLLIIMQLQPSVDFAVRDQQEIILKYRKEIGGKTEAKIGQIVIARYLSVNNSFYSRKQKKQSAE